MKYLVAYKPCGCPEDMIRHWPENIAIIAWREYHEGTGCKVLEGEPPELILPFCPHGSLPAQLAAKLREMEAREAGLKEWLQTKIAERKKEASFHSDAEMGSLAYDLLLQVESLIAVYEEVLAKMDETAPPAERRMQYQESPATPYVQAEIDRGLKLGKKAAEISERKKGGCEPRQ